MLVPWRERVARSTGQTHRPSSMGEISQEIQEQTRTILLRNRIIIPKHLRPNDNQRVSKRLISQPRSYSAIQPVIERTPERPTTTGPRPPTQAVSNGRTSRCLPSRGHRASAAKILYIGCRFFPNLANRSRTTIASHFYK